MIGFPNVRRLGSILGMGLFAVLFLGLVNGELCQVKNNRIY
jgi:hypothetical protein